MIPAKKHPDDLALCHWKKKAAVRCSPMMHDSPAMNRILPNPRRTRSKKRIIPRKRKPTPNIVNPMPIF